MTNTTDHSLGGAERRQYTGGMSSSLVDPTINQKLRKQLRKLDKQITKLTAEQVYSFLWTESYRKEQELRLKELDSKRFWIRLQLKGYK